MENSYRFACPRFVLARVSDIHNLCPAFVDTFYRSTPHRAQRVPVLPLGARGHGSMPGPHAEGAFLYHSVRAALRRL